MILLSANYGDCAIGANGAIGDCAIGDCANGDCAIGAIGAIANGAIANGAIGAQQYHWLSTTDRCEVVGAIGANVGAISLAPLAVIGANDRH